MHGVGGCGVGMGVGMRMRMGTGHAYRGSVADQKRITKIALVPGGREVLVYTTISGAVGVLVPFVSSDDVEFMSTLEMVS